MGTIIVEPSPEIFALRAGIALAELLVREFETIALERYAPGAAECPCQKGAVSAQKITQLCGKLIEELRRYERYEKICQSIDAEGESEI